MPDPFPLPPTVQLTELVEGYAVYEVDHPACVARVARHGAHLMQWRPRSEEHPVLYLSPGAVFREGKAIRGGIPVCWPWFNAHPGDPSQPAHGFGRTAFWDVTEVSSHESGVSFGFAFARGPWAASMRMHLGEELTVSLRTTNAGSDPVRLAGALHSYLRVGDIARAFVQGLEESLYLDTVGEPTKRQQFSEVRIDREVDRIYESDRSIRVVDPAFRRNLVVGKAGSPSTVVWNPWREKAAEIGDLPDHGYRDFLCVEAAISNDRAVVLEPGQSHALATTIRVERH